MLGILSHGEAGERMFGMGAIGGARPRLYLAVLLAMLLGVFSAARDVSAGVQPRLTFTETLGQDVKLVRYDDGVRYPDLVTAGTYRIQATLPMSDVDLENIDEGTPVYFRFAGLLCNHYLGDDFNYSYGMRKAHFKLGELVDYGNIKVPLVVDVVWNKRNAVITVTGRTPELQDPLVAQEYLATLSKVINTTTQAEFGFGDVYQDFTVAVKGRVTSRTREYKGETYVVSKVRLTGKSL